MCTKAKKKNLKIFSEFLHFPNLFFFDFEKIVSLGRQTEKILIFWPIKVLSHA